MAIRIIFLAFIWGAVILYYLIFIRKPVNTKVTNHDPQLLSKQQKKISISLLFNKKGMELNSRYYKAYNINQMVPSEQEYTDLNEPFDNLNDIYSKNNLSYTETNDTELEEDIKNLKQKQMVKKSKKEDRGEETSSENLFQKLDSLDSFVKEGIKKKSSKTVKNKPLKEDKMNINPLDFFEIQKQIEKEYEDFLKNGE